MRDSKKFMSFLLKYTAVFIGIWVISHLVLFYYGKSILYWDDCISGYYEAETFKSQVLRTLLQGGSAWTNWNLYGDYTLSSINGRDIFDLIWLLVPMQHVEATYIALTMLRVYVGGLGAALLLRYRAVPQEYIIPGSMVYVLYGFILVNEVLQPVFTPMFLLLPFLLWAMERLIRENKGLCFSVLLGMSILSSVPLTYFLTLGLSFYFCLIIARDRIPLRDGMFLFLRVAKYYLLGILLGMPLGFSEVRELFATPRLGTESHAQLSFSLLAFVLALKNQLGHFFLVGGHYVGFSSLLVFPVAYLSLTKSRKRVYLLFLVLGVVILNLSILKDIFGETIATDRWSFQLGVLGALLFAETLPEMLSCQEEKNQRRMFIIAGVYGAAALLILMGEGWKSAVMLAVTLGGSMLLYSRMFSMGREKARIRIVYGILLLSAAVSGLYAYTVNTRAYTHNADAGTVNARLGEYVSSSAVDIFHDDTSFYRVDQSQFTDEMNCNLNFWYGYNGISVFASLLNPQAIRYGHVMENTGLPQINKAAAYGGKFSDEILAGVKYYLSNSSYEGEVPYGFEKIRGTEKGRVYQNTHSVSLIMFYDKMLSEDRFKNLNIAEKEELILKTMVTETAKEMSLPQLNSREIGSWVTNLHKVEEENRQYIIKDQNAYIDLELEETELNGELYVELQGVTAPGTGNPILCVSNGYGFDSANVGGENYIRKNQQHDFCFLLGSYDRLDKEHTQVRIAIPRGKNVKISGIKVYSRDLTEAAEDVQKLNRAEIEDVKAEWDYVAARANLKEDGHLLFSVPYRKGWKCYVDGKPVDTFKANIMYIGTEEISKGEHKIELRYVADDFYIGLAMCACSALILTVMVMRKHRKRRMA